MTMNYKYNIWLGDPSSDGHGKCDMYRIMANKSSDELEAIQELSKKKLDIDYLPWEKFCTNYEDNNIPVAFVDKLISCFESSYWKDRAKNLLSEDNLEDMSWGHDSQRKTYNKEYLAQESILELADKAIPNDLFDNVCVDISRLDYLTQYPLFKAAGIDFDHHIWYFDLYQKDDLERFRPFFDSLDHKDQFFISCADDLSQFASTKEDQFFLSLEKNILARRHQPEIFQIWNEQRANGQRSANNTASLLSHDMYVFENRPYPSTFEEYAKYSVDHDQYLEIMFMFYAVGDETLEIQVEPEDKDRVELFSGGYGLYIE